MSNEKIISRIKNLLDMAEDVSSPNEAMIAAKRARTLMDKHQITHADLKTGDNRFAEIRSPYSASKAHTWVGQLALAMATLNDCQAIIERRFKIFYQFRGFKADTIIAAHMHEYLIQTCLRLLDQACIRGVSNKNYFKLGFASQIQDKVQEIIAERKSVQTSDGKSLVVVKAEMVEAHFDAVKLARKPKVRSPDREESSAFICGFRAAEGVSLNQQIED